MLNISLDFNTFLLCLVHLGTGGVQIISEENLALIPLGSLNIFRMLGQEVRLGLEPAFLGTTCQNDRNLPRCIFLLDRFHTNCQHIVGDLAVELIVFREFNDGIGDTL